MENKLKPCPFCGSKDIIVKRLTRNCFISECWEYSCRAIGPTGRTEEEAIEAWNRRTEEE